MKRNATHSGSWYTSEKIQLNKELDGYFDAAQKDIVRPLEGVKAIIAPHAGFAYSGPTAAFAYQSVDTSHIKRVFLLGPSHHIYLDGCALSQCSLYETPLGDITLDTQVIKKLEDTGEFTWMNKTVDEDEHSLEMHLPFMYKLFESKIHDVKLVPILVGSISSKKEAMYGQLLSLYMEQPENLFIISSDFCHWGRRFDYTYYTGTDGGTVTRPSATTRPIHESIRALDLEGIGAIEAVSFSQFKAYLDRTDNTICGRHPIAILLAALETLKETHTITLKCVKYAQSSSCERYSDSSVSYASLYAQFK